MYSHSVLTEVLSLVCVTILKKKYGKLCPVNYQRYALYLDTVYTFTFIILCMNQKYLILNILPYCKIFHLHILYLLIDRFDIFAFCIWLIDVCVIFQEFSNDILHNR